MKAKLHALKKMTARTGLVIAGGILAATANAQAATTAPDFSTLTSTIDMSTVVTAVLAVAGVMVGVYVAIKGARIVLRMVKGA
ncbi:hypothetical protein DIE23_14070 [Burkholderia sp. Bp9143]|uniref:major capsid protein n=1 Tax=Burkholderia sp. Bp9143 TaxID=2184574 RepID=UPI000F5AE4D8|nr:major capsid protein [Burkholderia sp. Bp9143]RQR33868.1 hypothetical protein DIE23_14070 [Burkholderia sp. Bp9143]